VIQTPEKHEQNAKLKNLYASFCERKPKFLPCQCRPTGFFTFELNNWSPQGRRGQMNQQICFTGNRFHVTLHILNPEICKQ